MLPWWQRWNLDPKKLENLRSRFRGGAIRFGWQLLRWRTGWWRGKEVIDRSMLNLCTLSIRHKGVD
jgi:hypothetical protein